MDTNESDMCLIKGIDVHWICERKLCTTYVFHDNYSVTVPGRSNTFVVCVCGLPWRYWIVFILGMYYLK